MADRGKDTTKRQGAIPGDVIPEERAPDEIPEYIDTSHWLGPGADIISEFRRQHGDIEEIESASDRGGLEIRSFADPLAFYAHRKHITLKQYRAGRRIGILWHRSILRVRYVQSRYGEITGEVDLESLQAVPREYLLAMNAIRDLRVRSVIHDVCCMGRKAGKRGGMSTLIVGLDVLADWFDY